MLPPQFADLEHFAPKWCRETEEERYSLRLGATMDELQDFYDAALPLGEEAQAYLDKFDLYDLPDQELNLLRLMFALIVIVFPVEAFRQAKVPDTGSTYLTRRSIPVPEPTSA